MTAFFWGKPRLSIEDKLSIAMHKLGEVEAENARLKEQIASMQSSAGRALSGKARDRYRVMVEKKTAELREGLAHPSDRALSASQTAPIVAAHTGDDPLRERICTCHPDYRPSVCQHRYALSECINSATSCWSAWA